MTPLGRGIVVEDWNVTRYNRFVPTWVTGNRNKAQQRNSEPHGVGANFEGVVFLCVWCFFASIYALIFFNMPFYQPGPKTTKVHTKSEISLGVQVYKVHEMGVLQPGSHKYENNKPSSLHAG